jgi:hypothetical protein
MIEVEEGKEEESAKCDKQCFRGGLEARVSQDQTTSEGDESEVGEQRTSTKTLLGCFTILEVLRAFFTAEFQAWLELRCQNIETNSGATSKSCPGTRILIACF